MNKRPTTRGGVRRGTPGRFRDSRPDVVTEDMQAAQRRSEGEGLQWKKMDLHLHTPASSDYRDPGISYLDILKKAEEKGLDIIAFADHNTVAGYAAMNREIETLQLLERLGRLTDKERATLDEYRRLLKKIVVLPAFEFTATFGFHVLGIFPENTSVRKLEYLLLNLNVPEEKMVAGAPDAGATSDVLTAYQAIAAAGGLAIAAHANSSNGVAMQGFPFGGQTKIAYTQDPNLSALEVTDLESTGRRTTASFFNASKTEYARRMHCIQGSDAHSLDTEQMDSMNKRLGVGARITEILVREASFAGIKEVLTGTDFTRTRPYRANWLWDLVESARIQGPNIAQSFHERAVTHTSRTRPIVHDVLAFANTTGGTVYVGANPDTRLPLHGLERPEEDARILKEDISSAVEPLVDVEFDIRVNGSRGIVVINVPRGNDPPYIFTPTGQIYIRDRANTRLATRQEMIDLVLRSRGGAVPVPAIPAAQQVQAVPQPQQQPQASPQRPPTVTVGEPMSSGHAGSGPALGKPQQQGQQRSWRDQRDRERERERERERGREAPRPAAEEPVAAPPTPAPPSAPAPLPRPSAAPERPRPSYLANLPPEKIKGRIQPMITPEASAQAPGAEAPTQAEPLPQATETEFAAPQLAVPVEEATTVIAPAEAEAEQPKSKRARGRGRKRGAEAEVAPVPPLSETGATAEPMEATVAAEHETRQDIVSDEPGLDEQARALLVGAPTAAAAETSAGEEAVLTAAEVEPGAQIPAELPPAEEAAPAKKSRSRRKTAAQKAAEAEAEAEAAEAAPPAEPAPKAAAKSRSTAKKKEAPAAQAPAEEEAAKPKRRSRSKKAAEQAAAPETQAEPPEPPHNGVEVVSVETRNGHNFHTMRDMRNGSMVHNVTRQSARRLWFYAILQHEKGNPETAEVFWHPNLPIGVWRRGVRADAMRYDLVARYPDGSMRIFYGVTDEGLSGPWAEVARLSEEAGYEGPRPTEP